MSQSHDHAHADDHGALAATGHVYDGIQEYDNPTPGWWNWLFIITVVHSLFYWIYFHSGVIGRTSIDEYKRAVAANMQMRFGEIGDLTGSRAEMIQYTNDAEWLKVGEIVYQTNCISCHGKDGGGIQGPNLTDDHYKNVREIEDLHRVVAQGANNGAMPAWQNRLHPNEVVLVACYVASLRGTVPANPKAPEGNVIAPWPTAAEAPADDAAATGDQAATDGAAGEAAAPVDSVNDPPAELPLNAPGDTAGDN